PQTDVSGVRHSTFTSLRLGRSSQSIVSNILASYSEFIGITVLFFDEKVNVVGQIRYVQDSDLTKETARVVIRLLIDP
ncbi:hypothetical protein HID58_032976, partial [Brassica napus]